MNPHIRANLWLLSLTLVVCSVFYPSALFVVGQVLFHERAEGSLVQGRNGKLIGSRLIAQPFTDERYFRPRPSAASYNGAASAGSNWAANNYLLRDRVARALGPIVKHAGDRKGQPVGRDIEAWFQKDHFGGQPGIVEQWAAAHSTLASNWVKADPLNGAYVMAWADAHADEIAQWKKDNNNREPKPEDLAGSFFASYSKDHPGTFPSAVEAAVEEGKAEKQIRPVNEGSDIQGIFFDMWRQEHPTTELEPVPADMVMASGSGLDPHITLENARYQLDRVSTARAAESHRDPEEVRRAIETLLQRHARAPLGGLAGVDLVNVLELNLALRELFP
jgi:K+-transporting ATPase ATPase C chain